MKNTSNLSPANIPGAPDVALHENISHQTDTAPYSIHYTEAISNYEPILYLHWHDEMEFFLLTQGHILFHIEDKTYELHAKEGIFIPPGLLHYANNLSTEQPIFYAFVLSPEFLFSSFDSRAFNTYVLPVLHNNQSFATTIVSHIDWQKDILNYLWNILCNSTFGELYIRGLTLLIWDKMYQNHIAKYETKKLALSVSRTKQLTQALTYIHEHYQTPIELKDLATHAHLSEGQFCRTFKILTGMTPFHYLIRYRILQSCTMLLQTDNKITDIALTCGFNNISYYNRAFLKYMKITPKEYRKSICNFPKHFYLNK